MNIALHGLKNSVEISKGWDLYCTEQSRIKENRCEGYLEPKELRDKGKSHHISLSNPYLFVLHQDAKN